MNTINFNEIHGNTLNSFYSHILFNMLHMLLFTFDFNLIDFRKHNRENYLIEKLKDFSQRIY